jgi:hypothetical protein
MTVEFIIIHHPTAEAPILEILRDRLRDVLEANLNDVDEDSLNRMVRITFERTHTEDTDGKPRAVLGLSLDIPEATASIREVVDEFTDALVDVPILHAVKCEDPQVWAELAARAVELFALEMKLRRVLTIIYLHAYPNSDPYDFLHEESVQPIAHPKPQREQMEAAAENQLFHLTFGQYVNLNQRPAIRDLGAVIRSKETYDAFRDELLRQPVEHEDDAVFIASLKARMDSVEKMRNAVAHNRRPSKKVTNDYLNALPLVNQALDDYLSALAANWRDTVDVVGLGVPQISRLG